MALFPTYNRFNLTVEKAHGTKIFDQQGKEYLDFGSGIGVTNLGHQYPKVKKAIEKQLNKYWHTSNLYHVPLQEKVAKLITDNSVMDYVFFSNSGAEANEAAIKLARRVTGKDKIITFNKSFHGRSFATMAATGQDKIRDGFGTMLPTFAYANFNEINSVKQLIDENTAAIMLELVQGEGGVRPAEQSFIDAIDKICKENNVLLIIDEIQTGIGRTGKKFAYEHYDITPDIITLAKGLGNGLPVGAMAAQGKYRDAFGPGTHGSTFGGNPLAMAASEAVLTEVFAESFLSNTQEIANYLNQQLKEKISNLDQVKEIRQLGLMIGIECQDPAIEFITELLDNRLVVLSAGDNVIRLLPPLTITHKEVDHAINLLHKVLQS